MKEDAMTANTVPVLNSVDWWTLTLLAVGLGFGWFGALVLWAAPTAIRWRPYTDLLARRRVGSTSDRAMAFQRFWLAQYACIGQAALFLGLFATLLGLWRLGGAV